MGEITHAHVVYMDSKNTFYTVPIGDVKCKKNSKHPIKPQNDSDFVKTKVYYVKWSDCESDCEEDHQHFGYYPVLILLLGESEEDIQNKAQTGRRLTIPNIIESTESEEPIEQSSRKIKRAGTSAVQVMKKKTNNEILQKHKKNAFLESRQSLIANGSDERTIAMKNSATDIAKPISHTENEIVSLNEGPENQERSSVKTLSDDNDYLQKQLQAKEKEMENLKKLVLQVQQDEIHSHSTIIADPTKSAEIKGVRRALFQEDGCERKEACSSGSQNHADKIEENVENSSNLISQSTGGSPTMERRSQKLGIRSNVKVIMKHDDIKKIRGNTREGDRNLEEGSARKKQKVEEPIAKSRTAEEPDNNPLELGGADSDDHMEENESSDSDVQSGEREDHDNDGTNAIRTKRRLESRLKTGKSGSSDLMNRDMNKKLYTEIRSALKHYARADRLNIGPKRYEVSAKEMIYLGEGLEVCAITWFLIKNKKPTIFFKDLLELMWGQRTLVNRCQNITRVITALNDRSPMKELTPEKKRLSYKLFYDHLDSIQMKATEKMKLLMKVPALYSEKINYLRARYYT